MKHTNKYAIQALKNEYADYPRNEQHYNRQYRMIVDALEMVKDGNSPTVADLIGSFDVWEEAFKRKRDFIQASNYLKKGFNSNVENTIILNESGFEFLKELKKDYALKRYKPDHNRPRPNKGMTPDANNYRRELFTLKRVMTTRSIIKPIPITTREWVAVPLVTGLDNIN
jgi:hypothetical protein